MATLKEIFHAKIGVNEDLTEGLSTEALTAKATAFFKDADVKIAKRCNVTLGDNSKKAVTFDSPINGSESYKKAVKAMTDKHGKGKPNGTATKWTVDGSQVELSLVTAQDAQNGAYRATYTE